MQTRMGGGLGLGYTTARGGGGFSANFYVDSARPNDSGDGTTPATAKKTLTAGEALLTTGQSLGTTGSFAEALTLTEDNNTIAGYGASTPTFDGAGAVAETWTRPDAVGAPNIWEISFLHGFPAGGGRIMVWKNGALLTRMGSAAAVVAEGQYFHDRDNNFTLGGTSKVTIFSTTNPNSDGALYERTQRKTVIGGAFIGTTGTTARNLVTGRQGDNDGSLVLGAGSTIDRVLAYDGHKHNALQETGLCKDSAFINAQPESNYLHVFYTPTATSGDSGDYENCVFVGQTNGLRGTSGVYCHDNSGVAHDVLSVTGCTFVNVAGGIASAAATLNVTGAYIENVNTPFTAVTGSVSEITHLLVNKQYLRNAFNAAGAHAVRQSAFYAQSNTTIFQMTSAAWGDVLLENSTIHIGDWDTTITNFERNIVNRTTGTGTFSAQNCVFIMENTDTTVSPVLKLNTASIGTWDNNVYFYEGTQSKAALRWQVDGVNLTFAQWQALGHDLNSIVVDDETDLAMASFLEGDPANGDFRLKSGLSLTLPDNTPVSTLGVQEHYDFNTRQVVAGAPSRWPTAPETYADGLAYIEDPTAWDFYP